MTKFFQSTIKYVIIAIFSLTFTITFSPKSYGQIPLFISSTDNQQNESLPWDLNKAYPCGKFWCSDIYIYDFDPDVENQRVILTPELTVTALKEPNQPDLEVAKIVEQRGELVQRVFQQIFQDM